MKKLQTLPARAQTRASSEQTSRRSREKASRFALLGMLSFGGYRSGYDLRKAFASSAAHFWSESYGNIYPRLRELAEEDLIRSQPATRTATGRKKQLYGITAKGRRTLRDWLSEPVMPRHEDNELLLKLFFANNMPASAAVGLVVASRMRHQQLLGQFDLFQRSIQDAPLSAEEKTFLQITVDYGRAVSNALVCWAEQTERKLDPVMQESLARQE